MEVLSDISFEADADALLESLRIPGDGGRADELRQAIGEAARIARPRAAYRVCYVEERTERTVRLDGVVFTSRVLRVNLEEAERVFPFVATCGRELADFAATFEDPLVRFALDATMRRALGAARSALHDHIAERFAPGKTATMSPGSLDDWPLSQQRELFALLGDVRRLIGVELTESCLMVPLKSTSGIIFPTEVGFESCQLCPRQGCPGRRAPYEPGLRKERYGLSETPHGRF